MTGDDMTAAPRRSWLAAVKPYTEPAPLSALFLGISSGFPFAMIAATLTTRLAQSGIDKKSVTAFSLAILVYNFKFLWAWVVDGVRLPVLGRLGQRVSWMLVIGLFVMAAVANLAFVDPQASLLTTAYAAILVGLAGASFDIVIDAYRIELLEPEQLGVGAGMSQYGYRIGNVAAGAIALLIAGWSGWTSAYLATTLFAIPAMATALVMGEPTRRRAPIVRQGLGEMLVSAIRPFNEFFRRQGAALILLFILVHKLGDTLSQLTVRLLYNDLGYSNGQIALYDVGFGFWAYLIGVFIGGILYSRMGLKRSVMLSLWLMALTNLSFAALAAVHTNASWAMASAQCFENIASGIGGVTVVAYFSALCDLRFTAAQFALISAGASIVGRFITGTTAGRLIDAMGYVNFYLLTTVIALPGILVFWIMMRTGVVDRSIGSAGEETVVPPVSQPPAA
jgi:PAT family beta-lactamase induction signal transducer AmpG